MIVSVYNITFFFALLYHLLFSMSSFTNYVATVTTLELKEDLTFSVW